MITKNKKLLISNITTNPDTDKYSGKTKYYGFKMGEASTIDLP